MILRQDHASDIAEKHDQLNQRTRNAQHMEHPIGSNEWRELEARKEAGESTAPVLIGFEGLGRGIHFDGVDTVYILGLPQKPKAYLHYAGRVGRLGQKAGKVVSIIPAAGEKVLKAWASNLEGIFFREFGPAISLFHTKRQIFNTNSFSNFFGFLSDKCMIPFFSFRKKAQARLVQEFDSGKRLSNAFAPVRCPRKSLIDYL